MRFVRLEVTTFQGVQSAVLDFAPGLNVLYGPNDLGKSTLARAIRAVLLVPATSAEATAFHPWHSEDHATVTLDFTDDSGRYWRVRKAFGSATGSQLWFSKDGKEWTVDARAREVDEKLRALLPWGIAAPGGKKRGLPQSFLTNALLGEQDGVESILAAGLDSDQAESGKLALTRALAALAQDPIFKRVLLTAQAEVDRFFTEKGKRKTGQSSPITAASEAVKKLQVERASLAVQLEEAAGVEERVVMLRNRGAEVAVELDVAKARLAEVQARFEKSRSLRVAEAELAKIDAQLRAASVAGVAAKALEAEVGAALAKVDELRAAHEHDLRALKKAEADLAAASSGDAAKKRELERAQLDAKVSKARDERRRLEALGEKAAAALRSQREAQKARGEVTRFEAEAVRAKASIDAAAAAVRDTEGELALAEGIVAYGRWRVASEAAEAAAGARAEALKLSSEALTKQVEAQQHEGRAKTASDAAEAKLASLPNDAALAELKRLEHSREVAEAALGGGVTVIVKPRRATALRFSSDDDAEIEELGFTGEKVIDADRRVKLAFGDLVDVEIAAGAPEKRRAVEVLKKRWREAALPVLQKAGAASLADIDAMVSAVAKNVALASEARAAAAKARAESEALRGKAAVLEKTGSAPKEALGAKEARIGALPRDVLATFFDGMGETWETQCETLRVSTAQKLTERKASLAELERTATAAEWNVQEATRREREAAAELPALIEAIQSDDPAGVAARVARELEGHGAALRALETTAAALEGTGAAGVGRAKEAVTAANSAVELAARSLEAAVGTLEAARARLHTRQGEVSALEAQTEGLDRAEVAARVISMRGVVADETDVASARAEVDRWQHALDEVREAFHKADGALTSSLGGTMAKEQLRALDDAILAAQRRERELSTDAESWKLLRDALREAEKTESAHLGKALGGAVGARFSQLTAGKYAGVTLDQQLKTEAVVMNGVQASGESVLEALSVGTRDQLATLVRLTVASELKTAIVLDDQLVHTDDTRLEWFGTLLRAVAESSQVLIFTCRLQDYLSDQRVRTVDLTKVIRSH